jgi:phytoene dehydrogenase-like protein
VHTANGFVEADAVVSNADITHLYKDLLPNAPHPEKALAQPLSTSAVVFYWGIKAEFPELGLHNIFFSDDYKTEFADIFERHQWPAAPTVYVHISSKCKPDDAPVGGEAWFVLVNVPARVELDTPDAIAALRQKVLGILAKRLGRDIESLIEAEDYLSPSKIKQRTNGWQGALYGSNSNSLFSGFWRHPNFSDVLEGLFFTGGTVHPGGGIPLALKSGQIAAKLATEFLQKQGK